MSDKSISARARDAFVNLAALGALCLMALSALYCAVAIVLSVFVDHLGLFASLQDVSAALMARVDVAAFVFATVCIGAAIAASGVPAVIGVLAFAVIFAVIGGFGYGMSKLAAWGATALAGLSASGAVYAEHLWLIPASVIALLVILFACSTTPRNRHAVTIALATFVLAGCALATARVVWSLIGPEQAPHWSFISAVMTWSIYLILGSVLLRGFVERAPPHANAREVFESWLMASSVLSVFIALYAGWIYVREGLGVQGWWAAIALYGLVVGALALVALMTFGAMLMTVCPDADSSDKSSEADSA